MPAVSMRLFAKTQPVLAPTLTRFVGKNRTRAPARGRARMKVKDVTRVSEMAHLEWAGVLM